MVDMLESLSTHQQLPLMLSPARIERTLRKGRKDVRRGEISVWKAEGLSTPDQLSLMRRPGRKERTQCKGRIDVSRGVMRKHFKEEKACTPI